MSEASAFPEMIRRVRAGDQDAAAELVRDYESTIRRVVRFRMVDARLGSALDSMDICQSVLGSFFVRAAFGQYDLEQPQDLIKLLVTMARNKLAGHVRKERAARRDNRRVEAGLDDHELLDNHSSPSQNVARQDLLEAVQRRLSAEEMQLVELRKQGLEWNEIADRVGENPEALRKRLSRALDRVTRELGLDEER